MQDLTLMCLMKAWCHHHNCGCLDILHLNKVLAQLSVWTIFLQCQTDTAVPPQYLKRHDTSALGIVCITLMHIQVFSLVWSVRLQFWLCVLFYLFVRYQGYLKTTGWISMKITGRMGNGPGTSPLDFGEVRPPQVSTLLHAILLDRY